MKVTVTGYVPVSVVVDTDEDRVERAVVGDEEFGPRPGDLEYEVTDEDGDAVGPVIRAKALKLIDEAEWPMWEFGW